MSCNSRPQKHLARRASLEAIDKVLRSECIELVSAVLQCLEDRNIVGVDLRRQLHTEVAPQEVAPRVHDRASSGSCTPSAARLT
jgi:hypothetical protein